MDFLKKKLTSKNKILLVIVILLMVSVYFFPVWFIRMGGNQFPEPLKIFIWADKISGGESKDIYTINDFNHYIGMKKIYPDSIPELKFMPYILGFMIFGGILTLLVNRIFLILLGILNTILVGIAGLYDYYRWLFNYGNDLDSSAPLYDSSVDFQPPIIACKSILNVTTCSWPHAGTILLLISIGILIYIIWDEKKHYEKAV